MNKPTVGRVVHYRETADADALAAVVCAVLEDGSLALSIFNANGHPSGAREVLHEDDAEPGGDRAHLGRSPGDHDADAHQRELPVAHVRRRDRGGEHVEAADQGHCGRGAELSQAARRR